MKLCDNCAHPLPNDTGTYCPHCGEPRHKSERPLPRITRCKLCLQPANRRNPRCAVHPVT